MSCLKNDTAPPAASFSRGIRGGKLHVAVNRHAFYSSMPPSASHPASPIDSSVYPSVSQSVSLTLHPVMGQSVQLPILSSAGQYNPSVIPLVRQSVSPTLHSSVSQPVQSVHSSVSRPVQSVHSSVSQSTNQLVLTIPSILN